ncbi:MAG: LamG domain-containing protein [Deltaproteobacteria bacterium]|nr:LamG domain-containing protein [Deltaproteobacteria bacterium]
MLAPFASRGPTAVLLVVGLGALAVAPSPTRAQCPADMVGYWTFDDGTAVDALGLHDGVVHGATPVAGGFMGGAFAFDGDDLIEVAPSADFEVQALTLEAWIAPSDYDCMHGFCSVFASGDSDGTPAGHYTVVHPGGTLRFVTADGTNETNLYGARAIPTGAWTHVAVTVDATSMKVYLDGVEAGALTKSHTISHEGHPLQIGSGVARYFRGLIDEVAIHARALTAAEIEQHYLNGLGGADYCAPPDFDFDGVVDDGSDLCPGTPAAERDAVDVDGCGPSQRDSDGDGLSDAGDACIDSPASDLGFIVDAVHALGCGADVVCAGLGGGDDDPDDDGFGYRADLCPWTDLAPGPTSPVVDGCSCGQILQLKPGGNGGERKHGCTAATLREFAERSGWAQGLPRPPQ